MFSGGLSNSLSCTHRSCYKRALQLTNQTQTYSSSMQLISVTAFVATLFAACAQVGAAPSRAESSLFVEQCGRICFACPFECPKNMYLKKQGSCYTCCSDNAFAPLVALGHEEGPAVFW